MLRTIWRSTWPRLGVTAITFYAICFMAVWFAQPIATLIVLKAGLGLSISVNIPASAPPLKPSLLLTIIPILPFWLAGETGRPYGKPLPFGSYALFALVFFFAFFVCVYIDVSENQKNAATGIWVLVGTYLGAAVLAAATAAAYFLVWRRLESRRPAVVPDVF